MPYGITEHMGLVTYDSSSDRDAIKQTIIPTIKYIGFNRTSQKYEFYNNSEWKLFGENAWLSVFATNDSAKNGLNLVTAYASAVAATPRGLSRSDSNRITIALSEGIYQLPSYLDIVNTGIDIIGLGRNPNDVIITSANASQTIKNRANTCFSNLTIVNTGTGIALEYLGQTHAWTAENCITTDTINGTHYWPIVTHPVRSLKRSKYTVTDIFDSLTNWTQNDAWRGSHSLVAGTTPFHGSHYIDCIGYKSDGGNADEIWMIYTYAAPKDITTKMYIFGYTVVEDNGQNYATTSGGVQVVWTDNTGKTSQMVGLPTQVGRHVCNLSWVPGAVSAGFDPTNVVSVSIKYRGGLSDTAVPKPEMYLEDWIEVDTSANTPKICMGFDDGLIGSINNAIWPSVRLGVPTYLAHRFDYTGLSSDYATESMLESLYDTGMVEIAHHSSIYPANYAEFRKIEYLKHGAQEILRRGFGTKPIFVVPQGLAGGSTDNRCTPRDIDLMLQHCYGVRAVDEYITGLNGTANQQSGAPYGVLANNPMISGLLPCGKISSANLSSYLAANGVIDRAIAAKQSLILYCHNVTDSTTAPLPDMTIADYSSLLTKLSSVASSGVELCFMADFID